MTIVAGMYDGCCEGLVFHLILHTIDLLLLLRLVFSHRLFVYTILVTTDCLALQSLYILYTYKIVCSDGVVVQIHLHAHQSLLLSLSFNTILSKFAAVIFHFETKSPTALALLCCAVVRYVFQ